MPWGGRARHHEFLPANRWQVVIASDLLVTSGSDNQGTQLPISATKFQETFEFIEIEALCLHLHGPVTPVALEDRINLERLFAPVRYPLTLVDCERHTGIFDP